MKNVLLMTCLLLVTTLTAQRNQGPSDKHPRHQMEKMSDLSPEQRADLKTKRMTLDLNLTEAQQQKVMAINLEAANNKPKRPNKDHKPSATERYELASERLEQGIAMKAKLREVLNDAQFEKFEKNLERKRRQRKRHSRKERN